MNFQEDNRCSTLNIMKKFCFLFLASSGFSLLPPLAQSVREIQTLVADRRLYDSLGSAEVIQEIVRNEAGYQVVTQHYTMQVDLRIIRTEKRICGPAQFEFEFHLPAAKP